MHCVIVVITVFIAFVSLFYFKNLFSYSAIQPQVCNKLVVYWSADGKAEAELAEWHDMIAC